VPQVDTSSLAAGDLVWKNRDAALEAALRASYEGLPASAARKLPVQVGVWVVHVPRERPAPFATDLIVL
jgi:hypothetical protein